MPESTFLSHAPPCTSARLQDLRILSKMRKLCHCTFAFISWKNMHHFFPMLPNCCTAKTGGTEVQHRKADDIASDVKKHFDVLPLHDKLPKCTVGDARMRVWVKNDPVSYQFKFITAHPRSILVQRWLKGKKSSLCARLRRQTTFLASWACLGNH